MPGDLQDTTSEAVFSPPIPSAPAAPGTLETLFISHGAAFFWFPPQLRLFLQFLLQDHPLPASQQPRPSGEGCLSSPPTPYSCPWQLDSRLSSDVCLHPSAPKCSFLQYVPLCIFNCSLGHLRNTSASVCPRLNSQSSPLPPQPWSARGTHRLSERHRWLSSCATRTPGRGPCTSPPQLPRPDYHVSLHLTSTVALDSGQFFAYSLSHPNPNRCHSSKDHNGL